ncbi:MAG: DNA-binding response regulator [Acidobacteria bacterium 13_1_40CM_4_58_4]|nr:MAG: DNA-binding response regulator [Acidobacteria bacterium 13_1_40CM_4_58_4]
MTEQRPIRVFTVDDHPLMREGIGAIISSQPDMVLVAAAANAHDAVRLFRTHRPDVTLMDLRLPDMSGIEAMTAIRTEFPTARALDAGACGYLIKSMPTTELADAIRHVHAGKKRIPTEIVTQLVEHLSDEALTDREIEVLNHVAGGNRNRDIAERLFISEETVKVHIKHIMEKLEAKDRTQAIAIAVRRGIIQL